MICSGCSGVASIYTLPTYNFREFSADRIPATSLHSLHFWGVYL